MRRRYGRFIKPKRRTLNQRATTAMCLAQTLLPTPLSLTGKETQISLQFMGVQSANYLVYKQCFLSNAQGLDMGAGV